MHCSTVTLTWLIHGLFSMHASGSFRRSMHSLSSNSVLLACDKAAGAAKRRRMMQLDVIGSARKTSLQGRQTCRRSNMSSSSSCENPSSLS